ncbi:MAG: hypothetical protein RSD88_03180 [Anaerovoracaceae bacterium]
MSRNKIVLLVCALVVIYLLLPSEGAGGIIKANMLAILPYVVLLLIIYLVITINVLKWGMQKLSRDITDEQVVYVAKVMRITFDVKRIMGSANLIELYKRVNFSRFVSFHSKELLYNAIRRKKVDVPPPSDGKSGTTESPKSLEDRQKIKEARIGSNKKKQHAKRK